MKSHTKTKPWRMQRHAVVLETRVVSGHGGGPEKTILNTPRYLRSAGYETVCAYMHPPGDPGFQGLLRKADECDAPIVSVPDRGPWDWRVIFQLIRMCRRQRVTIWHGHDYKSNALGLLVNRFWPMRLVTTVHGWVQHTRRTPLYYKIDELCLPKYHAVLCVSEDLHAHCLKRGVAASRCHIVHNGIDANHFRRNLPNAVAKQRLGIAPERFVVGAVGRLSAEKGFDLLIRSVGELIRNGVDLHLIIAGSGDGEPQLQSLISQLNLADRVRILGHREDPRPVFEAMDVYVLSSLREGMPNSLLEAMALEVPVVATRINGVTSLVKDHQNGWLIEPNSESQIRDGIRRAMADGAARQRVGQAGRQTVVDKFEFANRMATVRKVYDALLQRN